MAALVAFISATVIENTQCDSGSDANVLSNIGEIQVDPCPGAEDGKPCVLYRGSAATITIKFTPSSSPSSLESTIAWVNGDPDLTFRAMRMRPDACLYVECPVKSNEENIFVATLSLARNLPTSLYPLKAKLQELQGEKRVFPCQLLTIKLEDPPTEK